MGCSSSYTKFKPRTIKKQNLNFPESNYLWGEYLDKVSRERQVKKEMMNKEIIINEKHLQFEYLIKGEQPQSGYPLFICLHNGKTGDFSYNNREFTKMQSRYSSVVENGIILTIKGSSDLSNMHHSNESLIFYDRIIKNVTSFCNVNSNKVYLIGVGIGGSSVYEIATRLTDRFAGIAIISGHSYGINLKNLLLLPMIIQVGENDYAFDRNKDAVNVYIKMNEMYSCYSIQNHCECVIHCDKRDNIIDNSETKLQNVVKKQVQWLNKSEGYNSEQKNTNTIKFLLNFQRNPLPNFLIWEMTKLIPIKNFNLSLEQEKENLKHKKVFDLTESNSGTSASSLTNKTELMRLYNHFYWIESNGKTIDEIGSAEVCVELIQEKNTIKIVNPIKYIVIMLNEEMVNYNIEVNFEFNDRVQPLIVSRNYKTERRTVCERGDPNYIFSAAIEFKSEDLDTFSVTQLNEY